MNPSPSPFTVEPGEFSQFMLNNPGEIAVVLRGLIDQVAQITVFFNEGRDMLLTTLAAIDNGSLILDFGPGNEINHKALVADKHFCVTTLDKVRVQFILGIFNRIEHAGRPAFRATLPHEVLRLQRREFYRLTTPVARPLYCTLPLPQPEGDNERYDAKVFDISGGGLGLAAPPPTQPFAVGMRFADCRIDLPEVGTIHGTLHVRNLHEFIQRSGARSLRAGCSFDKLPGTLQTLIQRYIIKVERERKARQSGMT